MSTPDQGGTHQTTSAPPVPYYEDISPTTGCLPSRAWTPRFDALRLELTGTAWKFRLSSAAGGGGAEFARPDFDDAGWAGLPVPRLGLPAAYGYATWFGGGPRRVLPGHEERRACRTVAEHRGSAPDAVRAPSGKRCPRGCAVGRADAGTLGGAGLRAEAGAERCWFTARRWTSEHLDAAEHTTDLVPGGTVWINLDHGMHGIGSQSCGPGVLPKHQLGAGSARFSFTFLAVPPAGGR